MIYRKTIKEIQKELETLSKEKINKKFEELESTDDEAKFVSPMSDFVIKTICTIGNSMCRKCIYDMFSYILGREFKDYELTTNETGLNSWKSIANRQDIHFMNKDKSSHINIEINKKYRNLATEEKNLTSILKIGGEFYSYLDNKIQKYTIPIRVELINLNNFHCPFDESIPKTTFWFRDKIYNLEMEEIKIYNIYLPKYLNLCYDKYAKEEEKTLAMLNATSYKMLRTLAKKSIERMAL